MATIVRLAQSPSVRRAARLDAREGTLPVLLRSLRGNVRLLRSKESPLCQPFAAEEAPSVARFLLVPDCLQLVRATRKLVRSFCDSRPPPPPPSRVADELDLLLHPG